MVRINDIIDDEDLALCIDGCTDLNMIRRVIDITQQETLVDVHMFAEQFAKNIEGFIEFEKGTSEWREAYENNFDWGIGIADSINDYIYDKWTKL